MIQGNTLVEEPVKVHEWRKVKYKEKTAYDIIKRVFDIVASLFALILLSPLLLVISIIVFVSDWGNPLFVQDRVGKNGKKFRMYKFRSMYKNAEQVKDELMSQNKVDGPLFKITNDPRVTKIGSFIRKTSIDELPQIINILKGEMSVIGPRPFIPSEQAQLPDERLLVKPGLSCYWQIGGKNSLSVEEQMELDFKYIEERSFLTDLKIVFRTIGAVFKSDNY